MKILVTGGTGFAGSHLVSRLLSEGKEVRVLVRPTSNFALLKELGVEIVLGDITDRNSVTKSLEGIDIVFHIAAAYRTAGIPDKVYWEVNVEGTRNVLEASTERGVKRFIHCSTIGVHGDVKEIPATELTPFNPGDVYQITKLEGEKLAIKFYREKGLPVVVIRPMSIYGPGDTRLLKLFKMVSKGKFIMLGDGNTLWHGVYIDDLVSGFKLAAEKNGVLGEAFIIGGDKYVTLNELVKKIANAFGVEVRQFHIPARPLQILGSLCESICIPLHIEPPIYRRRVDFFTKNRAFDISKAREKLGYQPKFNLELGIKLTVDWYKEKGFL